MIEFEEVAVMDRNSEYRGVPPMHLMENAGKGLAQVLKERFSDKRFLFICGTGNNGGDGYVAARYLSEWLGEEKVKVFLIKGAHSVRSEISKKNLERMECEIVEEIEWEGLDDTVLIDGLLGTGISGRIREPYRNVMKKMNQLPNIIVSIDIPSGLGADLTVHPEVTVTFHDKKKGMKEEGCGEIVVKEIGIPEEAMEYTGPGELILYPRPSDDSHKGENGTLLLVGGGPYTGAPALAANASYRGGVDLVHLVVPESSSDLIAGFSPNFIVHPLKGEVLKERHAEKILEIADDCDAALIGPGLGDDGKTKKAVRKILDKMDMPTVVDADGLKAVSEDPDLLGEGTVLTPHSGEMKMLGGSPDDFAAENDVTLLVKGKEDYVTNGERSKKNDFGTPSMTVGGTGDTLAGVVGCMLAKGMSPFDSARTGAYVTCRAGELAEDEWGYGLTPVEVADKIPKVFMEEER